MKAYFASDLHLGILPDEAGKQQEKRFIQWLDVIKKDATDLFLLGDMFDFWFEYKTVVPRGFVRFLGKIGELTDSGITVHYFTGNHDIWVLDYLSSEINVMIHTKPLDIEMNGSRFLIGHGHGLGDSPSYNFLLKIFENKFLRYLFAAIHPRWGMAFGHRWSVKSRKKHTLVAPFESMEKECLIQYSYQQLHKTHYDYFIFGHRHLPMYLQLNPESYYINTGEWVNRCTYAVWDGKDMNLHSFSDNNDSIFMITNQDYNYPITNVKSR